MRHTSDSPPRRDNAGHCEDGTTAVHRGRVTIVSQAPGFRGATIRSRPPSRLDPGLRSAGPVAGPSPTAPIPTPLHHPLTAAEPDAAAHRLSTRGRRAG